MGSSSFPGSASTTTLRPLQRGPVLTRGNEFSSPEYAVIRSGARSKFKYCESEGIAAFAGPACPLAIIGNEAALAAVARPRKARRVHLSDFKLSPKDNASLFRRLITNHTIQPKEALRANQRKPCAELPSRHPPHLSGYGQAELNQRRPLRP